MVSFGFVLMPVVWDLRDQSQSGMKRERVVLCNMIWRYGTKRERGSNLRERGAEPKTSSLV